MTINLKEVVALIYARFKKGGIDNPHQEARYVLRQILGLSDADIISGDKPGISEDSNRQLDLSVARRLSGEPLSRILGEREFWSLPFIVTPDVLDPRPDSETVITAALSLFADRPPLRILDLGTGSGCLLITLLHEFPAAAGLGIDISPAALAIAGANAVRNNVAARAVFQLGDWCAGLDRVQAFDLIVSNPPYIPSGDIPHLESSVRDFDPILALDGGLGGLDAYLKLVDGVKKLLAPGGIALLEVGQGQAGDVMRLGINAGLMDVESFHDLAGIERVVKWQRGEM